MHASKLIVGSARLDLYKAYQISSMFSRYYRFFGGIENEYSIFHEYFEWNIIYI